MTVEQPTAQVEVEIKGNDVDSLEPVHRERLGLQTEMPTPVVEEVEEAGKLDLVGVDGAGAPIAGESLSQNVT